MYIISVAYNNKQDYFCDKVVKVETFMCAYLYMYGIEIFIGVCKASPSWQRIIKICEKYRI